MQGTTHLSESKATSCVQAGHSRLCPMLICQRFMESNRKLSLGQPMGWFATQAALCSNSLHVYETEPCV